MMWKFSAIFQVIHPLAELPVAVIIAPLFLSLETCLHHNLWLCLCEKQVSCFREQRQNESSRVRASSCRASWRWALTAHGPPLHPSVPILYLCVSG